MILKVDHIGVAVKDMDEAMKLYSDALGLKIDGDIEYNEHDNIKIAMVGVQDQFGRSGSPWQLVREYGLSAENIAQRALDLKNGKA